MIHSFVFSEGKLVSRDLELEALRLVHGDKGLILWVDLDQPTDEFWIADVGQNEIEEINVVERSAIVGASFGWSYLESTEIFNDDQAEAHAGRTAI